MGGGGGADAKYAFSSPHPQKKKKLSKTARRDPARRERISVSPYDTAD